MAPVAVKVILGKLPTYCTSTRVRIAIGDGRNLTLGSDYVGFSLA